MDGDESEGGQAFGGTGKDQLLKRTVGMKAVRAERAGGSQLPLPLSYTISVRS